jgi:hypothetical protein
VIAGTALVSSTVATVEASLYAHHIALIDAAAYDANATATLVIVATPLAGALVLMAAPSLVLGAPTVDTCLANRLQCVGPVFQVPKFVPVQQIVRKNCS